MENDDSKLAEQVSTASSGTRPSGGFDNRSKPVKVPKAGELVARDLRNRIIRGELPEGSHLPAEAELMNQFAISRPTLREALRILEAESLITVRRGSRGGPTIHRPGPEVAARHFGLVLQSQETTLADVYRVRQLLEPPAIRMVIDESRDRAPATLRAIVKEEWDALNDNDIPLLSHCITRFHDELIHQTGNQTLILIMRMLNNVYEKHVTAAKITAGPDFNETQASHLALKAQERLIDLIEAGDADSATDYWRGHLEKVREVLFKHEQAARVIDVLE